jgi:hypothetical protein
LTFPSAVDLTVTGFPAGATATLTPSTVPAGAGPTPVALTILLPGHSAGLSHRDLLALKLSPLMAGMLLLPFAGSIRRAVGRQKNTLRLLLLLSASVFSLAALLGLTACGARDSGFFGQQQRTYTLTVTATSDGLSHSTTLTLTVQ